MANLLLIRDLCDKRKMTMKELGDAVGRDFTSIQSAIRRGQTTTATLEKIAEALGVSPGVFFDNYEPGELERLRTENEHLKDLLKEKERTIKILLDKR